MVVLSRDQSEVKFTPEQIISNYQYISQQFGMPIDESLRDHIAPSIKLCQAFVAVDIHQPADSEAFLRQLRLLVMKGGLNDDQAAIDTAAKKASIAPESLAQWVNSPKTIQKLSQGMKLSRIPTKIAHVLDHKLGSTPDGAKRYSAGSFQFLIDGIIKFELPGFWPVATYEAVMANIAPDLLRAKDPTSAQEILEWAQQPLATQEITTILNQSNRNETIKVLQRSSAIFQSVGDDGFWSF